MRVLGRLLLLLIILVGGAIVALSFVDLGRFAPQIEAAAREATGRTLKIEGPLHIGISLTPSLVAEKVRFSNATWGSRADMMTADKLAIKLDVIPLLSGKIALKSVELDGADIYVETDKSGKGNWEFGSTAPAAKKGGGPALVGVPEVAINDLKIAYRDGTTRQVTKAEFKSVSIKPQSKGVHATVAGEVNGTVIAFDADVTQSGDDISFANAAITVAGTSVKGDIAVNLAGTPTIKGKLANDAFDLTPLASGSGEKGGPIFSRDPLPLDQLNAANVDLALSVGKLTYGKVVLTNVKLPIKLQGGALNVPGSATYRGAVINFGVTGNGGARSLGLDLRSSALDIGKLFADLDVTDLLTAKADIAARLSGRGASLHAIAASASGQTNVAVGQGTVNSKMFAIISNDLARAVIPSGESGNTARLTCALSRFDFQGGVGTSKALAVETDSLITTGSGTVNLGTEQLDLVLKPKPKNASLASLAFPIRVSGQLASPSAGIDREGAAIGLATAAGGIALTGGVGALLPLMSTGSASSGTGGCATLAAKASENSGIVGGVRGAGEGVAKGVGGALEGVTKGIGGLFGK